MMEALKKKLAALVPRILKSKKGQAMIVGLVLTLFSRRFGIELEPAQTAEVVALIVAYIIGQGVADHGKEKVLAQTIASKADLSPDERARPGL